MLSALALVAPSAIGVSIPSPLMLIVCGKMDLSRLILDLLSARIGLIVHHLTLHFWIRSSIQYSTKSRELASA